MWCIIIAYKIIAKSKQNSTCCVAMNVSLATNSQNHNKYRAYETKSKQHVTLPQQRCTIASALAFMKRWKDRADLETSRMHAYGETLTTLLLPLAQRTVCVCVCIAKSKHAHTHPTLVRIHQWCRFYANAATREQNNSNPVNSQLNCDVHL